ncbi:MAG: GCN5-related N-acetyltransferase [Clostridiales bacterium]|jgi:predicted N-acetyltransferase YhbS|nr:GCN5-related N-acetyltransferase [Clostridiales bacterium]
MLDIIVRLEEEKDYRKVEEITRAAFSYPGRVERGGIGCPFEHWMVHALRKKDGIIELSYVAEVNGTIVGHVIYSNARVEKTDGKIVHVINFGPLSVHPEYQKLGIGKALMNATIAKATELGFGAILFFGRPKYYPQFGFVEAEKYGITDCGGDNYPAFMAMELKNGYLENVQGRFYESSIYDDSLNRDAVKEFDKVF